MILSFVLYQGFITFNISTLKLSSLIRLSQCKTVCEITGHLPGTLLGEYKRRDEAPFWLSSPGQHFQKLSLWLSFIRNKGDISYFLPAFLSLLCRLFLIFPLPHVLSATHPPPPALVWKPLWVSSLSEIQDQCFPSVPSAAFGRIMLSPGEANHTTQAEQIWCCLSWSLANK